MSFAQRTHEKLEQEEATSIPEKITVQFKLAILLGFVLLLCAAAAFAEQATLEPGAADALLASHPDDAIAAQTQWGDTAAAVLTKGEQRILCVAEKQNGSWIVTIDNPTALKQGEPAPELLLDTDTALFWRYQDSEYGAQKTDGVWGTVSHRCLVCNPDGSGMEYLMTFGRSNRGMVVTKTNRALDENENLLYETTDIPIPAESLTPYADLAGFDIDRFPGRFMEGHDWTNPFIRQSAAEQLMPGYTFLGGTIYGDSFEFLMQKPNGVKVFAGVSYGEAEGWSITESTPLPANTQYGRDNFTSSLYLSQEMLVNIDLFANGTWGVDYLYATPENANPEDGTGNEMILFGPNWIADSLLVPQTRYFGTHPWSDITTIDWSMLPMRLQDAVQQLDQTGWAMVNNPNPEDRLHLRTRPDKNAASLGKYYNGTVVQVLEDGGTWVKVNVLGVEGYMMKDYLAYGEAMNNVASAGPCVGLRSASAGLYGSPQAAHPFTTITADDLGLYVRGVVGEKWYHVWFVGSGLSGYMLQSDLWGGNG